MLYTYLNDKQGNRIYYRSLLKNTFGDLYLVEHDQKLGYIIFDITRNTVEKLNKNVAVDMKVIAEDTALLANQL